MRRLPILLAAVLAACVGTDSSSPPGPGTPLPDFQAVSLHGDTVSLDSFRGRPLLLNLWATWCAPCRQETPFLQSLHEDHADDGLEIVGVSLDAGNSEKLVREFVEEFGVTYTILLDQDMRGMDRFNVLGLPASFLVDRDGIVRWLRFGPVAENDSDFLDALEAVLR